MPELTQQSFVDIVDAVRSHAMATGLFEGTTGHEPKNAPGNGIRLGVWVDRVDPVRQRSGLDATAALLTLNVRVYQNFLSEPQDAIDPAVLQAVNLLMLAYSGDFELGGLVAEVDLLGQYARGGMFAQAGYLRQDAGMFRVMTISLPLVINDAWSQNP